MDFSNKKFFLPAIFSLISILAIAQQAPDPVVIKGTLAQKGTYNQIFLDTLNGQNPWIFVSSEIDAAGNFTLIAPIANADIFRLRLDDKNYMMLILEPGEKITIKTNGSKLGGDALIVGSFHTQLLYSTMNTSQMYESLKAFVHLRRIHRAV